MTDKQILRYLDLVDRKLELGMIGKDWKPEYDQELEEINRELDGLIPAVEKMRKEFGERERRREAENEGK